MLPCYGRFFNRKQPVFVSCWYKLSLERWCTLYRYPNYQSGLFTLCNEHGFYSFKAFINNILGKSWSNWTNTTYNEFLCEFSQNDAFHYLLKYNHSYIVYGSNNIATKWTNFLWKTGTLLILFFIVCAFKCGERTHIENSK